MRSIRAIVAAVGLCLCVVAGADNRLNNVRVHAGPKETRVVLDTSMKSDFTLETLTNPDRLVIDLVDTEPGRALQHPVLEGLVVQRIRSARRARGTYRVVLDLERGVERRVFSLPPVADYGHRLVIDLDAPAEVVRQRDLAPQAAGERDVVVAIDAGHGGEDPGAIGDGGVYEKRVVLAIANKVAALLAGRPGYRVALVRDGDYYVGLRERIEIARKRERADLFVSIHADAFRLPSVDGASVYALSTAGATSESARWLADRENQADLIGGVGDVSLAAHSEDVQEAILELSMDQTLVHSLEVGATVLEALDEVTKVRKKRVEQAEFVVLKSPDVPSILVETGYLSNPREAALLRTEAYQRKIARAIVAGLDRYIRRHPPPDSLIAAMMDAEPYRHVIRRGETMSGIAARYQVTIGAIRSANRVEPDRIRAGDVLLIPRGVPGG